MHSSLNGRGEASSSITTGPVVIFRHTAIRVCCIQQGALVQSWCPGRLRASRPRTSFLLLRSSAVLGQTVWTSSLPLEKVRWYLHFVQKKKKNYTSWNLVTFLLFFLQILEPSAQLEMCQLEEHRVKQEVPEVVWDSSAGCVLTLMACFHSYQFGNAVQRRRGSASHWSGQSGHFLSSQRRSDFTHSNSL